MAPSPVATEPEPVALARRRLLAHRAMVVASVVGFWPLLIGAAVLGTPVLGGYLALVVVGLLLWALTGWTAKVKDAQALVTAYDKRQQERELEASLAEPPAAVAPPALPAAHPLQAVVARLQALAADDAELLSVVNGLLAQLVRLEADQAALGPTVEALTAEDPRRERVAAVLQQSGLAHEAVSTALRDLLVELTARPDDAHGELLSQTTDLLARIAAEAEVSLVSGASGASGVPAPAPVPERSPAERARAAGGAEARESR